VVWLHALYGVRVHAAALEVQGTFLGGDGTLGNATRPESMAHVAPRVVEVRTIESLAGLSALEGRGSASDLEVDYGLLVVHALDGVRGAILGKLERAVVSVEAGMVLAEADVVQWARAPEVRLRRILGENLDIELGSDSEATTRRKAISKSSELADKIGTHAILL
jgi:hypothetical protein